MYFPWTWQPVFTNIHDSAWRTDTGNCTRSVNLSRIRGLFRLVKCKFTEPLYKSAWYTLLSLLIFRTHAQSVKWEGRNITKKKTEIPRLLHSSVVMFVNSTVLRLSRQPYIGYQNQLYCQVCLHTQLICFRDRSYHSATEWQWQNKKTQIIKTRNKKNK